MGAARTVAVVMASSFICGMDGVRMKKGSLAEQCGLMGMPSTSKGGNVSISIVNGDDAEECQWKSQISLWFENDAKPFCGGTLIDKSWVLSAAHCMVTPTFKVVAGDHKVSDVSTNQQTRWSDKIFRHPEYRGNSNDFALVHVDEAFDLTPCVGLTCLPTREAVDDAVEGRSECWISGWGTLSGGGSQPDILQQAKVSVIGYKDCRTKYGYASRDIDDTMICGQGKSDDGRTSDACQGDSGGPLVCKDAGQTWRVIGATSWGRGCAAPQYPGVWANVVTVLDWVDAVQAGDVEPDPPCPYDCSAPWKCWISQRCTSNEACCPRR